MRVGDKCIIAFLVVLPEVGLVRADHHIPEVAAENGVLVETELAVADTERNRASRLVV